jgi:flagellar P-ring protein precursor FlgI
MPPLRQIATFGLFAVLLALSCQTAQAASRIKDIVEVEGVRDNILVGYGLVVGLNGSGDSLRNSTFTRRSVESMLERLGVSTQGENFQTKNIAAVIVTANLPPFSTTGSRIDVTVSAMGDAKSLAGGVLLATELSGGDGNVYAVAQGPVAAGGFAASGDSGSAVTRNVPTNGRISSGAMIEREIEYRLWQQDELRLSLRNPDLTTAYRVAGAINAFVGTEIARVADPSTIHLLRPAGYPGTMTTLLADIELLQVEPDQPARIIIDEGSGVIVMGDNVRVSTVAIAQGNLTITVQETPAVSQPQPLAQGETVVVPQTDVTVSEDLGSLAMIEGGVPLRELVNGLNALGVAPRDMISILQALKAAGAIQAEIEVI